MLLQKKPVLISWKQSLWKKFHLKNVHCSVGHLVWSCMICVRLWSCVGDTGATSQPGSDEFYHTMDETDAQFYHDIYGCLLDWEVRAGSWSLANSVAHEMKPGWLLFSGGETWQEEYIHGHEEQAWSFTLCKGQLFTAPLFLFFSKAEEFQLEGEVCVSFPPPRYLSFLWSSRDTFSIFSHLSTFQKRVSHMV